MKPKRLESFPFYSCNRMMGPEEQEILNGVNADDWAVLYRCRWSPEDANAVVPQLVSLLSSKSSEVVDEALRALFRIGIPAANATAKVVDLVSSTKPITKRMAVLTLGQIAHEKPNTCVKALTGALEDDACCRDAMRILAFIGPAASDALDVVLSRFSSGDAKVRKAVVKAAVAVGGQSEKVAELMRVASEDRSKAVREAAVQAMAE